MKRWLKNWLGITTINTQISQLQADIYDNDSLYNGVAIPKVVYKETILFAGKQKPVK